MMTHYKTEYCSQETSSAHKKVFFINIIINQDQCFYCHNEKERRRCPVKGNIELYRATLCNTFRETGSCPNGDNCKYSHGYIFPKYLNIIVYWSFSIIL